MRGNAVMAAFACVCLGAWLLGASPAHADPSPGASAPTPSRGAAATPSRGAAATPSAARPLVVRKLYAGDEAGYPRKLFYTVEPAVYFYALVKPAPPTAVEASERSFTISVRDSGGHEVARLGGALPATLDPASADLPRDCVGAPPNGLLIADAALGRQPGRYHAQAYMNGAPAGDLYFDVKPLAAVGEVRVTSAVTEDARGTRRFTFTAKDAGVYAHVTLVNSTRGVPHEHLIEVGFFDPEGQRWGRMLGGVVHLERGTRLDGKDFPTFCDAEHQDGLRIAGTAVARHTGAWIMRLYVDGKGVRDIPFRIVPAEGAPRGG